MNPPLQPTLAPHFLPPAHNRSPSHSPTRAYRQHYLENDPLLSRLSPSRTLAVLLGAERQSPNDPLHASISLASPSERAFAVKAAVAHKKLRQWEEELSAWQWPAGSTCFLTPSLEERASKRRRIAEECHSSLPQNNLNTSQNDLAASGSASDAREARNAAAVTLPEADDDEVYWGSLPAKTVVDRESRIDTIRNEIDELEISDLKNQVLSKFNVFLCLITSPCTVTVSLIDSDGPNSCSQS